MKVLITGITGLLGSIVAADVHAAGHEVIGVSRSNSKDMFDFPVEIKVQDLADLPLSKTLLDHIDILIHCAANTNMGSLEDKEQSKINEGSVQELVSLAIAAKVKRFILSDFKFYTSVLRSSSFSNIKLS